jgi:alpha-ketoglutarate-dependent taurine dioxygenase
MARTALAVEPLTPAIGAVVRGVDLGGALSADDVEEISRALDDRLVLFFVTSGIERMKVQRAEPRREVALLATRHTAGASARRIMLSDPPRRFLGSPYSPGVKKV